MKIDHNMVATMMAWGRTYSNGRPVRLEFEANMTKAVHCYVFNRDPHPDRAQHPLSTLHPIAHSLIGWLP